MSEDLLWLPIAGATILVSISVLVFLLWALTRRHFRALRQREQVWNRVANGYGLRYERLSGGVTRMRGRLEEGDVEVVARPGVPGGVQRTGSFIMHTRGRPNRTKVGIGFRKPLPFALGISSKDDTAQSAEPTGFPIVDSHFRVSSEDPDRLREILAQGGAKALEDFWGQGRSGASYRPGDGPLPVRGVIEATLGGRLSDARGDENLHGRWWDLAIGETGLLLDIPGLVQDEPLLTEVMEMALKVSRAFQQVSAVGAESEEGMSLDLDL